MSSTEFKDPGTIGKPGPIGRVVRVLGGIFYFYFDYMFEKTAQQKTLLKQ